MQKNTRQVNIILTLLVVVLLAICMMSVWTQTKTQERQQTTEQRYGGNE